SSVLPASAVAPRAAVRPRNSRREICPIASLWVQYSSSDMAFSLGDSCWNWWSFLSELQQPCRVRVEPFLLDGLVERQVLDLGKRLSQRQIGKARAEDGLVLEGRPSVLQQRLVARVLDGQQFGLHVDDADMHVRMLPGDADQLVDPGPT